MPQIGWFEILIIVVLSILIIGPKDFPKMVKKIGNWVGSLKSYFNEVQKEISDVENSIEEEVPFNKNFLDIKNKKNKDDK